MTNRNSQQVSWKDAGETVIIPLPDHFDFMNNLGYLSRNKNECMFIIDNETVTRVITTTKSDVLVQLGTNENAEMVLVFLNGTRPTEKSEREAVVKYVHEWFDLGYDIVRFYEMARLDPILKEPVSQFYGLRLCGVPDLFEALCWGVLGQQINLSFAYTLKKQFVENFGRYLSVDGVKHWIFPTYEEIAQLTPAHLAHIKMTTRKSEYIIGIAQLMATGSLSKDKLLNEESLHAAEKSLTKIRGIGPWTANYILMRCIRFPDAFPLADVGLHNAIKSITSSTDKPSKEELLHLSNKWDGFQAYATFYLWRILY